MLVKVEFASFAVDTGNNTPLIMLKEIGGDRMLPVPIGPLEASAIAIGTLNVKPQKPFTIDVAKGILEKLGGMLDRVVFFLAYDGPCLMARLYVGAQDSVHTFECKPCDAIALALRCRAPLLVREEVFEDYAEKDRVSEREKLRKHVAALDTLDFGTFYLE
jgi:uncharacterized protein